MKEKCNLDVFSSFINITSQSQNFYDNRFLSVLFSQMLKFYFGQILHSKNMLKKISSPFHFKAVGQ